MGFGLNVSILSDLLNRSLEERCFLELHSRVGDSDKFTVGWIVCHTPELYIAATVDDTGRPDEYQAGRPDGLFLIVEGGEYIEMVSSNMMQQFGCWAPEVKAHSLEGCIHELGATGEVVTLLHSNGSSFSGPLSHWDGSFVALDVYSQTGRFEGKHYFALEDIERIGFRGSEQKSIDRMRALRSATSTMEQS
jgi:hypothetical protein